MYRGEFADGATEVVASYTSYSNAQGAVAYLSERRFPIARLAVCAADVRPLAQVTGLSSYRRAAGRGAASGGVPGALIGVFLGLFGLVTPLVSELVLALWGLIFGAAAGAVIGMLMTFVSRARHDLSSCEGFQVGRYDVVVDPETAKTAKALLSELLLPEVGAYSASGNANPSS